MIRQGCAYRKSFSSFTGCYYITAGGHPYFIDFILKKPLQQSTAQPHLTRQLLFGNRCHKLDISKIYFLNLGAELVQINLSIEKILNFYCCWKVQKSLWRIFWSCDDFFRGKLNRPKHRMGGHGCGHFDRPILKNKNPYTPIRPSISVKTVRFRPRNLSDR